jgi:chromate transporter
MADEEIPLRDALGAWLRVALLSFGGPAGQIAVMHRIVVEEKKWAKEEQFLHALNYCMLLPGPEAQQLATYLGWLIHGTAGGVIAGGLFILPGALTTMALSALYAAYGQIGLVASAFFGLKAAVLGIVLQAVGRLGSRALKTPLLRAIAAMAFVAIFFFAVPFPLVILAAAGFGFASRRLQAQGAAPNGGGETLGETLGMTQAGESLRAALMWVAIWLTPPLLLMVSLGDQNVFTQIAVFFSKMAVVTFGGAYAALAYVAQQAVERFHWLAPGEMLDGLGMAETTPGPLILVLQFVGFMAAYRDPGALSPPLAGALLASWVTFTPSFLWIFVGAPYIERLRGNAALASVMSAITAAVVGVIVNLAVWFSVHAIFARTVPISDFGLSFEAPALASVDRRALVLTLSAIVAIFRLRFGMLQTLAACSLAGVMLYLAGQSGG